MDHLSEVLKILDGALRANASMASNYAGLLADKLEQSGDRQQARQIRERLARAPVGLATAQDGARGISLDNLPVDGESRLHTVDVSQPTTETVPLVLPSAIEARVHEFLDSVRHHEALRWPTGCLYMAPLAPERHSWRAGLRPNLRSPCSPCDAIPW